MKIDTGIVTKGGKPICAGDIVRPAKRSNYFPDHELGKKWIVRLPPYPFVLVDVETGKADDHLRNWHNGELVIIGHEDVNDDF